MSDSDLYEVIGVDRAAPKAEIHRAFRKAAKRSHPDQGGSREKYALVCLARDVLEDDARREKYDKTGKIDDVGPDQTESEAMQIVVQAIDKVLSSIDQRGGGYSEFDVVSDAVKMIQAAMTQMKGSHHALMKQAAKVRGVAKRFRPKGKKPNQIGPMFDAQAAMIEDLAQKELRLIPAHERAIDILKNHSWTMESGGRCPPAFPTLGGGTWS